MFGFVTDLILREIEDRECLKEKAEDVSQKDKKKKMCTLFSGKASAIAIPPLASIMLSARLSVARVCVRKPKKSRRKTIIKKCSPCCLEKQQPMLYLLYRQSY
jgi:hypothetical protein